MIVHSSSDNLPGLSRMESGFALSQVHGFGKGFDEQFIRVGVQAVAALARMQQAMLAGVPVANARILPLVRNGAALRAGGSEAVRDVGGMGGALHRGLWLRMFRVRIGLDYRRQGGFNGSAGTAEAAARRPDRPAGTRWPCF